MAILLPELWLLSLKATEKMFDATNILFDALKLKCYNISYLNYKGAIIYESLL